MMRLAAILALCAAPAAAACPTADDLADGIVIETGKPVLPQTEIVKHLGGDLYWRGQHSSMFPDQWQDFKHLGAFEVYTQRASGSGKKHTTYDLDIPAQGAPVSGMSFETSAVWGPPDRSQKWMADLTITVMENDPVTVGDCTYDTLKIQIEGPLTLPDGTAKRYTQTATYFPQLRYAYRGFAPLVNIRKATRRDDVITNRKLRRLARAEPTLAQVLADYGIDP